MLVDHLREDAARPAAIPSPAIVAMLVGIVVGNLLPDGSQLKSGARAIITGAIPLAIVFMGAGLDLGVLADPRVGLGGLGICLVAMVSALAMGIFAARLFGLSRNTSYLLGVGTAICGSSAIIATSPVIGAHEDELVLTVATVNLMGLVVMFVLPPLCAGLGLSAEASGILAGATIHAIPQAIAAGDAMGEVAGTFATLFKLVRVSMLAPAVLLVGVLARRSQARAQDGPGPTVKKSSLMPWFLWGFLLLAALRTAGWIDFEVGPIGTPIGDQIKWVGKALLAVSMIAIGFELPLRQLFGVGAKTIAAGLVASAGLVVVVLALVTVVF
ncbi:MAG: putative integral membrane protein (TIGR00698 family) [Bacteroidia bacterium]